MMRDTLKTRSSGRNAVQCILLLSVLTASLFDRHGSQALSQEYVFRPYRQAQGLENLSVNSLAIDRQGFLWAGTENGVYRFLGSSFQRFGIGQGVSEQTIKQVFAASDGTLWVASDGNLYPWNGQSVKPVAPKSIVVENSVSVASEGPGHLLVIACYPVDLCAKLHVRESMS